MIDRATIRTAGRTAGLSLVLVAAAGFGLAGPARAADTLSEAQRTAAVGVAKQIAADPAVVAAVKAQNAKKVPLAEIQKTDKTWMVTKGIDDTMKALMDNGCAKAMKALQGMRKEISEAFAMDDQGANVCMTNKTSDYWQGDEAKWQKSFAAGPAAVFVDKPAFDESAQAYLVQVSVPVVAGGKAIGAVTVGINLERLPAQR